MKIFKIQNSRMFFASLLFILSTGLTGHVFAQNFCISGNNSTSNCNSIHDGAQCENSYQSSGPQTTSTNCWSCDDACPPTGNCVAGDIGCNSCNVPTGYDDGTWCKWGPNGYSDAALCQTSGPACQ